jgi:hypothetical protein
LTRGMWCAAECPGRGPAWTGTSNQVIKARFATQARDSILCGVFLGLMIEVGARSPGQSGPRRLWPSAALQLPNERRSEGTGNGQRRRG